VLPSWTGDLQGQRMPNLPSRRMALTADLSYFPPRKESLVNLAARCILRLIGVAMSLAGNTIFPNRSRRNALMQCLSEVNARLLSARAAIGEDPIVLALCLERTRLSSMVDGESWYSLDLPAVLAHAEQWLEHLSAKTIFVSRAAKLMPFTLAVSSEGLPPSVAARIHANCTAAFAIMQKPDLGDADKKQVEDLLADSEKVVANAGQVLDWLETQIQKGETRYFTLLYAGNPPALRNPLPDPWHSFSDRCHDLFEKLLTLLNTALFPGQYLLRDRSVACFQLIEQFGALEELVTCDDAVKRRKEAFPELARALDPHNLDLEGAALLIEEIGQDTYPKDINHEICGKRFSVTPQELITSSYELVRFRLVFQKDRFNHAGARREFKPKWDFGHTHKNGKSYVTVGWEASHYFPRRKAPYTVKVSFTDKNNQVLRDCQGNVVELKSSVTAASKPSYAINKGKALEFVRVLIVIVAAVLSVEFAAAQKVQQADVLTVAVALVALGFGADTLKNLATGAVSALKTMGKGS
jgi:hypothetical protein